MENILCGTSSMFAVVVIDCLIVLMAMCVDLCSGLYKAKQRGEIRSSWGLKRTLSKFIMYEGGMLIAAGIDLLIHFSHIYKLFNITALESTPVITCLLGVFLLIVEFLSVREKADEKTQKGISRVEELAVKAITKDDLAAILKSILEKTEEGK